MKNFLMPLIVIGLFTSMAACKKDDPAPAPAPKPFACGDNVTYEGQTYTTVQVGDQCWFAENLNVGTRIDIAVDAADDNTINKYCYDDTDANCDTYGGLYTWDEMMEYTNQEGAQGICPGGWHIPSKAEFETLLAATNNNNANELLPNGNSGFDALFGGFGNIAGDNFSNEGAFGYFYTSTEGGVPTNAWRLRLSQSSSSINDNNLKINIYSVRCLKD